MRKDDASKQLLGKLLATENITIFYDVFAEGPCFDLEHRTLVMPVWNAVGESLKDLMIGHEVGHALFTPADAWGNAVEQFPQNKNFFKHVLNVVEDARIERLIKDRYPGLRRPMFQGYTEMMNRGFFDSASNRSMPTQSMPIADRINTHFKLGVRVQQTFTPEEQQLIDIIDHAETFAEVVAAAKLLYQMAHEEAEASKDKWKSEWIDEIRSRQNNLSKFEASRIRDTLSKYFEDLLSGSAGTMLQDPLEKLFDDMVQRNKLLGDMTEKYGYAKITRLPAERYVLGAPIVHARITAWYLKQISQDMREELYQTFLQENDAFIKHLVREFEVRRNARKLDRARLAKTGEINADKLWKYQLSDDLFLQNMVMPNHQNHGMLMVLDFSGSMQDMMYDTLIQTLCLSMFCRRVNIPFEVYTFCDNVRFRDEMQNAVAAGNTKFLSHVMDDDGPGGSGIDYDLFKEDTAIPFERSFRMHQLMSGDMSAPEFKQATINLLCLSMSYGGQRSKHRGKFLTGRMERPDFLSLGSTPLIDTTLLLFSLADRFKQRHHIDVLNTVILTDGDPSTGLMVKTKAGRGSDMYNLPLVNYATIHQSVLFDEVTKKEVTFNSTESSGMWHELLDLYRKSTHSRVIGFYVAPDQAQYDHEVQKFTGTRHAEKLAADKQNAVFRLTGFDHFFVQRMDDEDINSQIHDAERSWKYQRDLHNRSKPSSSMKSTIMKKMEEHMATYFQAAQKKKAVSKSFIAMFVRALS